RQRTSGPGAPSWTGSRRKARRGKRWRGRPRSGLLVQDWDMSGGGRADTLRLLFATPRHWLRDGATIKVERAPTAFGDVSLTAHSELAAGRVTGVEALLGRPGSPLAGRPAKALLRLRLPDGHAITAA